MTAGFSPVAGIQWVETSLFAIPRKTIRLVSVPLPGFSGLRPFFRCCTKSMTASFSPVAGIQWVETSTLLNSSPLDSTRCFSPVAGIQWVETLRSVFRFQLRRSEVSVPLPGFSGLRQLL